MLSWKRNSNKLILWLIDKQQLFIKLQWAKPKVNSITNINSEWHKQHKQCIVQKSPNLEHRSYAHCFIALFCSKTKIPLGDLLRWYDTKWGSRQYCKARNTYWAVPIFKIGSHNLFHNPADIQVKAAWFLR